MWRRKNMKNNGNEFFQDVNFKENTDYFRMSDGVFWTIEALAKKYDCAVNTIYKKGKELDISTMNVLGIKCYKDDIRFEKSKGGAGNIEHLKGKQISTYAELYRKVEEAVDAMGKAIGEMFSARVEANSNLKQQYQAITANTNTHNDWHAEHNKALSRLNDSVKETNRLLNEVLNYLTTSQMEKAVNEGSVKKDA